MCRNHCVATRVSLVAAACLAVVHVAVAQTTAEEARPAVTTPADQTPSRFAAAAPKRSEGRWMIEVHGATFGSAQQRSASTTTIDAFPTGASFTTTGGQSSRAVSSWAFGDGAVLFNQVRQAFGAEHGLALPAITPLDAVMRARGTSSTSRTAFGGRLTANLTSWLALEVAVERGSRRSRLTDDTVAAVEATRASYVSAFQTLLTTVPQTNARVTSTATSSPEASGNQTIATGSLVLSLVRSSRLGLHALVGGGIVQNDAAGFEATLTSNYQFRLINTYPINESETVTIRFAEKKQVPVGLAGLGLTLRLAGRTGLRLDARMLVSEHTSTTTVDATPSRVTATPTVTFPSLTTPSIQFSTIAGARTSLSGDPVTGLQTYRGSGYELRPQFTVGYYVRF